MPGHVSQCVALHRVRITTYYSGFQINANEKIVVYIKCSGEGTYCRTLMIRSEVKQTLVRYRWDDNIKADRKVLVLEGVDCNQYCSG